MQGRGVPQRRQRPIVYCLVPRDLAPKLHELLRRHFRDDPAVEVIVERRGGQRRGAADRRGARRTARRGADGERRRIRDAAGRRVGERRAAIVAVEPPAELPRRARAHADRLVFLERLEPIDHAAEDLDTARLVTRIQAGESDLFALLYVRYFERVYGYLRVALDDPHDAEDGAQQVFVNVLAALPRYRRERAPFRAWLFAIVRNYAVTQLQRSKRLELLEPDELARRAGASTDDDETALRALDWVMDEDLVLFIERLPLAQRQVLLLRYMLDLSHAQTAAILGRNVEDVRNLQSRALRFLRARLAAVGREPRRTRTGMVRCPKKAPVLRLRRFALTSK
jgi:RNA polymerase sigma-70 factor (ECF subfamily)